MSAGFGKEVLGNLRAKFRPNFESRSFDLRYPQLDRQFRRRLKRLGTRDAKQVLVTDKSLLQKY